MHVFYLHGFASSPRSSKAVFLGERLAAHGIPLHCPDFNEPDFSTLTITRMLGQLDLAIAALPADPVALIGSSLGGLVAVEAAARAASREGRHPVTRLILLAPAVELDWGWDELGTDGIERWRRDGRIEIFHYANDARCSLNYGFYEDAARYDTASRRLQIPMLIVQGTRDDTVASASVERFARAQPRATLHLVDDGHQLKDTLPFIWQQTAPFLGLVP